MQLIFNRSCVIRRQLIRSCLPAFSGRRHVAGLVYRIMEEEDKPQVRQLLYDHYFTKNPVCQLLKMDSEKDCEVVVDGVFQMTKPSLSVLAINRSDQVVGISLQGLHNLSDSNDTKTGQNLQPISEKLKVFNLFHLEFMESQVTSKVNIYDHFGVDRYMRLRYGTVHYEYTRKGVVRELVLKVEEIAKQNGIFCLVVVVTNQYSHKPLGDSGFQCLAEIPIAEFVYQDKAIFANSEGKACLFAKHL